MPKTPHPDVLVGLDKPDDAGVIRLADDLALIQTVDYFTPIVDDPFDYGAIAAANSLSDVYSMGGVPISVLNIVGFPRSELDLSVLTDMLRGGQEVIAESGAALVGGHSVKSPELFYGLSVSGKIHPDKIVTNSGAQPEDVLILTKPLGTGVLTTALKKGKLSNARLQAVTEQMRRLNRNAAEAMVACGANACTDVTGFGFAGHLFEMAHNSGVDAYVYVESVPLIDGALDHAKDGDKPGGLGSNRSYLASRTSISEHCDADRVDLLFDPQTSGGLLISVPKANSEELRERLEDAGETSAVVGEIRPGDGIVQILP